MVAERWDCFAFRASFTTAAAVAGAEGGEMRLKLLREGRVVRISMGSARAAEVGRSAEVVTAELRGCWRMKLRKGKALQQVQKMSDSMSKIMSE
jgi:hypothetical protein